MVRNEKTGRFESTKHTEMTEEQREAICYKSKLLNKYFDTYAELQEAEAAYVAAHEAELKAKEEKKTCADKVKAAITERLETELKAKEEKNEAYRQYLAVCEEADKKVTAAKKVESNELKEFCEKYGAFHDTITFNDMTYTCDYSLSSSRWIDPFERLFRLF